MLKTKNIALILGVLVISLAVSYLALAWIEPEQSPALGNVPAPVNVGDIGQRKFGDLRVVGFRTDSHTWLATEGGNVGIGTTSPRAQLEIKSTGGSAAIMLAEESEDQSPSIFKIQAVQAEWDRLDFFNVSWDKTIMSLIKDGKVGIGTKEPAFLTEIVGGSGGSATTILGLRSNSTTDNTATTLRLTNSGVANPSHYRAEITSIRTNVGGSGAHDLKFSLSDGSSMVDRMIIKASGNVGIGTTDPQAELEIRAKRGMAAIRLVEDDPNATSPSIFEIRAIQTGWDRLDFFTTYDNTTIMSLIKNGNVGIGTTDPWAKLHVWGNDAIIGGADDGTTSLWLRRETLYSWRFKNEGGNLSIMGGHNDASNTLMFIHYNGNVGIGTTSPAQKLDVNGNIRIRGILGCQTAYSGFDDVTGQPIAGALSTNSSGDLICIPVVQPIYSCLEGGSLVLTPDGFKKIENLRAGDSVIGYKEGEKMVAEITKVSAHDGKWTLYYYKGYWFTGNHKVYTDYENFERVFKLSDVTKEYIGSVYDITVGETQNYFGENGLLIHNK